MWRAHCPLPPFRPSEFLHSSEAAGSVALFAFRRPLSVSAFRLPTSAYQASWRPRPDLNRNTRFRKPLLYPVELRGRMQKTVYVSREPKRGRKFSLVATIHRRPKCFCMFHDEVNGARPRNIQRSIGARSTHPACCRKSAAVVAVEESVANKEGRSRRPSPSTSCKWSRTSFCFALVSSFPTSPPRLKRSGREIISG